MITNPVGNLVGTYAHVGIIVEDLDAAMTEMTNTLGIQWLPVQERPNDDTTLRLTFSAAAPFIELIEGSPGTSRDTTNGPHVDHLAYWTSDFDADKARMIRDGMTLDVEGSSPFGGSWCYLSSRVTGFRVELCDVAAFEAWHRQWGLPVPELPEWCDAPH